MQCPACRTAMIVLEIEEIEIDYCLQCGGVWLDGGELELLLEGVAERDALLKSFHEDAQTTERQIKCPICSLRMKKVTAGTGNALLLDICANNDGIWFDKGELHDLIRMGEFSDDNRVFHILNGIFGNKE